MTGRETTSWFVTGTSQVISGPRNVVSSDSATTGTGQPQASYFDLKNARAGLRSGPVRREDGLDPLG